MKFDRDEFGADVESQRGMSFGGSGGFGGIGGMILPLILSRFGIGGVIVLAIVLFASGGLNGLFSGGQQAVGTSGRSTGQSTEQICQSDQATRFACNVFVSTEQVWAAIFRESGQSFRRPKMVVYSARGQSGCGSAQSAMGPFYCPSDEKIYLDTEFFQELAQRFGASGDFAQAYVVAHEMGHHIQTITGISDRIRRAQQGASEAQGNALQVRMELQADCYAGVWGSQVGRSGDQLDSGDLEEGLRAAQAIGDDTLQRSAGRTPVPESFTHGTSAQRQQALQRGFQGGTFQSCAAYTQGI